MNVSLENVNESSLILSWDPVEPSCPAIHYTINASNCGSCPVITNETYMTCTNPPLGTSCDIDIRTVVCDDIVGMNTESIHIIIKGMTPICHHSTISLL